MKPRRNKNAVISLALFFVRTFFFNPLNNPVFIAVAIFIAFFYMEGSLDKYQVALILYLSILCHYFIGNMFTDSAGGKEDASKIPIMRYFQALPISGRKMYSSYLLSCIIYFLFFYLLLGLVLMHLMKLPDLKHMQFVTSVTSDGDTITTLTGTAFTPRGIPYHVSIDLDKSLLFDPVSRMSGGTFWISLYFFLVFLYLSVIQVFKQFRPALQSRIAKCLYTLPFAIYLLLGLTFMTELILSQKAMGTCTRTLLQHLDITISLFLVTTVLTIVSILFMSKRILDRLKLV